MTNSTNRVKLTIMVLSGLIALLVGIFAAKTIISKNKFNPEEFHGTWLEHSREINNFSLESTNSQIFNNNSLKGKWTLLFFGFTRCGYLCPTTLSEMNKMYHQLEEKGIKDLPQVVLITVDPENDSLSTLNQYVKSFNPHFIAARGSEEMLKNMASEMGVAYTKVAVTNNSEKEQYSIEHTGTIMVFNPKGELKAFFTTPHQAATLSKDYLMLIS
jgi:protein SCO1/2